MLFYVVQFYTLQIGPPISCPAISSCNFKGPSFSCPPFSVNPNYYRERKQRICMLIQYRQEKKMIRWSRLASTTNYRPTSVAV